MPKRPMRDILADHLGAAREPITVDLNAEPDDGWSPPALNDNKRLKAQIMAAIAEPTTPNGK